MGLAYSSAGGGELDRLGARAVTARRPGQPDNPGRRRGSVVVRLTGRVDGGAVRADLRGRGGGDRCRLRPASSAAIPEGGAMSVSLNKGEGNDVSTANVATPGNGATPVSGVTLTNVSKWYGNVVAVNDITMTLGAGVTGLLGPNGAGKTTLLHMMAGFLPPSRGEVLIGAEPAWRNPGVYKGLGLVSEREAVHPFLTGWEFVFASAKLHRLADPTGRREAGHRAGRDGRAAAPAAGDLLQGHAPAHPGRRGTGPRPGRAAAGRAVQRDGSAPAHAHDGPAARHGRCRAARCCSARTSSRRSSRSPAPCR